MSPHDSAKHCLCKTLDVSGIAPCWKLSQDMERTAQFRVDRIALDHASVELLFSQALHQKGAAVAWGKVWEVHSFRESAVKAGVDC